MELPDDLKAARDVVQGILKSKKIIRMYPSNNPIYVKTIEDTYGKFRDYFMYRSDLVYKIRQNDIVWDADQVYYNAEKDDNLALFFFKDGLRELSFKRGLTSEEMEEFLKIISLDFEREVMDDDIVTLLWEKDFQNIRYIVDEAVLADEEQYAERAIAEIEKSTNNPDSVLKAYHDAFSEEDIAKEVSIVPLSDKDLQLLMVELEKFDLDKTGKLADILFETMYHSETETDIIDLVGYFMGTVDFAMRRGNIVLISQILAGTHKILKERSIDEKIRKHMEKIVVFAGSEAIITLLGDLIDSGHEVEDRIVDDFVRLLDKNAISSFMNTLGELESIHGRKIVIDALIYLGPKDIMTLSRGLNDSRWYVVRNIIYILRKIADKRSVEFLLKTVRHADVRVKKEVIRALGELGGGGVFQTLRECLDDADVQVRSAALRSLGTMGTEAAKRIIIDRIASKYFRDKDFEEKKEHFEVLSKWKDKEVYNFLLVTLKKKTFFRSSKNDEVRAGAAYGLGLVGNKDAIPILSKYKGESNKLLREFSFTAIKRIEHG
jgi:HEAT repeat protein